MMKGLDIARSYFEEFGRPMLEEKFPDLLPELAAGLVGEGSECSRFDDEVSRDHDFEPGFCLFLPGEDVIDRRSAFLLERAYAALPREFMGLRRSLMQPVGGARRGVIRITDFLTAKTGTPDGRLTPEQWLALPEQSLAECVNGEIFFDNTGEITAARGRLAYYPEDVRRKKLAGSLLVMAQAGLYNYSRCLSHGETAAAQTAVFEFVSAAMKVIFLLNRQYMPYYKWSFRALRALPELSFEAELFELLMTTDNDGERRGEKQTIIEGIAADVIDALREKELSEAICGDLEKHAYSVNDGIKDPVLRNMHVLAAV